VIIWLNGTFGAGKTTTARQLAGDIPDVRIFDPEYVGYMVAEHLRDREFTDFQQLQPWRTLVPIVMDEITRFTGQSLIAPQTVLVADYWRELRERSMDYSLDVFHVLLHVDPDTLAARIRADEAERQASGWRLEHLTEYAAAQEWMVAAADLVVDSTNLTPAEVSTAIQAAVSRRPVSAAGVSPRR
jgi:hypothetical protein